MKEAVKILEYFGLVINYEKSSLIAKQQCKYLGFIIDTINFSLNLPNKKKSQIVKLLEEFKFGKMYKIRKFAELLGVLTSACPAVAYGFIYCKRLERQKFLALKFNGGNYERKILITDSMMEDLDWLGLAWWRINTIIGSCPIRTYKYTLEIFSDSSLSGWGCYCEGKEAFGFWNKEERKNHINYLELLAAFFAIKCFASKLSNQEFLLRLDNTTAIAYINRAGGVQYPHLSELSRKIWEWCEKRHLWLKASYIPSAKNVEADRASRYDNVDSEWELARTAFEQIDEKFGPFSVDLFASRLKKKKM
ncbi:GSCOCG00011844001-RA-CDS [Cotesia congregata]|nr:GSCOCG00011844001-RA-CDS [Cotesia congregata]